MTRKDVARAAQEAGFMASEKDVVDFALEMVRRHNEECAKIAERHINHPVSLQLYIGCPNKIYYEIREAKP